MMCKYVIADIYLHMAFRGPFGSRRVPEIPLVIVGAEKELTCAWSI